MTANVAVTKSSVLFDYLGLPGKRWDREQFFAGVFLI